MDNDTFVTRDNFKNFVNSNKTKIDSSCCDHSEYKSWKNISREKLNDEFIIIGDLNDDTFKGCYTYTQQIDEQYEYWREDSCFSVNLYPAQSAIVYQCPKCRNIFLQYMEDGGHGSQTRFRLVKPDLIKDDLASYRFKIEEQDFQMFLDDLGLSKSDFKNRIHECNDLYGVPLTMNPNEIYVKTYSNFKDDEFPKTFEIVTKKIKILELIKKYKKST